jgi:hypothetical protein
MSQTRGVLIGFLSITAIMCILLPTVNATTFNFSVNAGQEVTKTFDLEIEDRVLIEFSVIGGQSGNTLGFYIVYPNETVKNFGAVATFKHSFICDKEGEYIMRFSNVDSSEEKLVSLNYEIQHYIFGMPQMLFLTLVIVTVCLAAVAVFILRGKPR